eukprot:GHRQ01024439.1.p1 GENE.GHRQ01024439.1~~GHRQ01024439.1.p1  ORF type:complete len:108 (+),score=17.19 GHRQ01024439.1:827-1150(+)
MMMGHTHSSATVSTLSGPTELVKTDVGRNKVAGTQYTCKAESAVGDSICWDCCWALDCMPASKTCITVDTGTMCRSPNPYNSAVLLQGMDMQGVVRLLSESLPASGM